MDTFEEQIKCIKLATQKHNEFKEEMVKLNNVNLTNVLKKILYDVLTSVEDLHPENVGLILSKCDGLSDVISVDLKNDIVEVGIYRWEETFDVDIHFLYEDNVNGGDYVDDLIIEIEKNNLDKLAKIINGFELINVNFGKTSYAKEQLLGG